MSSPALPAPSLVAAYATASKSCKSAMIDALVHALQCSRPQARRMLGCAAADARSVGRPPYGHEVRSALVWVWALLFRPNGRYLAAVVPDAVAALAGSGHPALAVPGVTEQLCRLSGATIDRMLTAERGFERDGAEDAIRQLRQAAGVAPRAMPASDDAEVTLAVIPHCGQRPQSPHLSTLALTERDSGWRSFAVVSNLEAPAVAAALDQWHADAPFGVRRVTVVRGSERIGNAVQEWTAPRRIAYGSIRPYSADPLAAPRVPAGGNLFHRRLLEEPAAGELRRLYADLTPLLNFYVATAPLGRAPMTPYRRLAERSDGLRLELPSDLLKRVRQVRQFRHRIEHLAA